MAQIMEQSTLNRLIRPGSKSLMVSGESDACINAERETDSQYGENFSSKRNEERINKELFSSRNQR